VEILFGFAAGFCVDYGGSDRSEAQGETNRSNTDAEWFCSDGGLFGIGKDWNV